MFGLSFSSCQLIQGPAVRTWNCVAHFANLIWYKFNHVRPPIMPRSRRRHHSRSRTRSRSHSYDRDREPKRRKIESYESPQHKRSISPESNEENEARTLHEKKTAITPSTNTKEETVSKSAKNIHVEAESSGSSEAKETKSSNFTHSNEEPKSEDKNGSATDSESDESEAETSNKTSDPNTSQDSELNLSKDCNESIVIEDEENGGSKIKKSLTSKVSDSKITPKKALSPKQLQKRLELEKEREEKRKEREKKKQELLEEKQKVLQEKQKLREEKEQQKLKEKQEKQEQKQKEIEEKQKEKELKEEKKKKEREEKEQKRKEREEQKQKELEEKNKEKQKIEEKKQKAATVFANFFTKKSENVEEKKTEESLSTTFMPFEVKSDMRLAPILRKKLSDAQKANLVTVLQNQTKDTYLDDLKMGKSVGKCDKTWPPEDPDSQDDVVVVEDVNPGESIEEQAKTNDKMRAKYLKFNDNRRPAYFGTWRKKSKFVKPRKPLALDKEHFDYEVDSDEDWEEGEDKGESLHGSDDEEKENESENEYEVDNDFFVPHGHLSDDEVNDEEDAVISPEAHKAKLKLLKKEFDEEMMGKTHKIKPRVIGCIWYNKDQNNVDCAIREFLKPLSIISNGPVIIKKRSQFIKQSSLRKSSHSGKPLSIELIPDFLKLVHGNTNNRKTIVGDFLNYLNSKNLTAEVSKASLLKQLKQFAEWMRCPEDGPMRNKFCWIVNSDVKEEYCVDLSLENK